MLIIRDIRTPRPTANRIPGWLESCRELARRSIGDRDHFWAGEPFIVPEVPSAAWRDLPDDFQIANVGPVESFSPEAFLRVGHGIQVCPVLDAKGRTWHAPIILDANKAIQLDLAWGRDPQTKALRRMPDETQARLIAVADAVRSELDADRFNEVDVSVQGEWALPLLEAVYHLSGDAILAAGLLDDRLAHDLLRVAAGYAPTSVPAA
jgi:hypothetical protein